MAKAYQSVDEYIACQPEQVRPVLEQVRDAIRAALPEAEEVISYNIAGYKIAGKRVIYFASWKKHYSIYPATATMLRTFSGELSGYEIEKSTIKFSFTAPVPAALIGRLAEFRKKEEINRGKGAKTG